MLTAGCALHAGSDELGGRRGGGSDLAETRHLPRVPRRPALLAAMHACLYAMRVVHFVQRTVRAHMFAVWSVNACHVTFMHV